MGSFSGIFTGIIFEAISEITRPTVIISSAPEQKAEPQKVEQRRAEPQKVETKKVERKDVKPEVTKYEYF